MYLLTTWDAFQMVPSFPWAHFMVWMIPKGKNLPDEGQRGKLLFGPLRCLEIFSPNGFAIECFDRRSISLALPLGLLPPKRKTLKTLTKFRQCLREGTECATGGSCWNKKQSWGIPIIFIIFSEPVMLEG